MQGIIRKARRGATARRFLFLSVATMLTACATKKEPQLISDSAQTESSLPWNQQEKWENQGQLGPMAERFERR